MTADKKARNTPHLPVPDNKKSRPLGGVLCALRLTGASTNVHGAFEKPSLPRSTSPRPPANTPSLGGREGGQGGIPCRQARRRRRATLSRSRRRPSNTLSSLHNPDAPSTLPEPDSPYLGRTARRVAAEKSNRSLSRPNGEGIPREVWRTPVSQASRGTKRGGVGLGAAVIPLI